ncbi:MAG: serine/threonine protein kinase [Acidobacteria bacterium]|nr:serine/threonine protein kinase [Acidobacteriota bacterium]
MATNDRDPDKTVPSEKLHHHSAMDEGRFPPGSILAQRYRIISLLGQGGMGEVYRANDLLVGQPVALKFLPEGWARQQSFIERFRNEVRTARMVSHPNVCRVHDLGEADGRVFLSMEFINGEDLDALLRRIGRLPEDKGLEVARKLCAGLHAAHEKNILHRDLKPANIMIDARGEVIITDFGLAAAADSIQDIRSGTPAYMAPEQRAGHEVTVRSDIYSLGMVLHEMFTGKCAVDSRTTTSGLDPLIAAVIERCLQADPVNRPFSALAVARALPGGDPLAAALAAGKTPSPEMVAASGESTGLKPAFALPLLVLAILGPIVAAFSSDRTLPATLLSPEELRVRARDMVKGIQGAANTYETSGVWVTDGPKGDRTGKRLHSPHYFWFRSSPVPLGTLRTSSSPLLQERIPGLEAEGMALVRLDMRTGRLMLYESVPRLDAAPVPGDADWNPYLRAAGIDPGKLSRRSESPDSASWWYTDEDGLRYEVDAVSEAGRLRLFRVRGEWERNRTPSPWPWIIESLLVVLAMVYAWKNHRAGRTDLTGALSLVKVAAAALLLSLFLRGGDLLHWSQITPADTLIQGVGFALLLGVAYLAMEPYVRRGWPRFLVTWVRLLRGNWRDATVGRDVLIGFAASTLTTSNWAVMQTLGGETGLNLSLSYLQSTPFFLATLCGVVTLSLMRAVSASLVMFFLRLLLRNRWAVAVVWVILFAAMLSGELNDTRPVAIASYVFTAIVQVIVLIRFGFLAKVASEVMVLTWALARTLDPSRWYSTYSYLSIALIAVLAIGAYRVATREHSRAEEAAAF